jgi:hypothetical protein
MPLGAYEGVLRPVTFVETPLGAYEGVLGPVQINEMPLVSAVLRHARVGTDWIEGAARVV